MLIMEYYKSEVKKYEKKYKKKTKTGNVRHASTVQYSIQLLKDNPFQEEDFVYILKKDELQELLDQLKQYELAESSEQSDSNNYKNEIETLNLKQGQLEEDNKKLLDELADIKSERDICQNQLSQQQSKVHDLTTDVEDLKKTIEDKNETILKKDSKINVLNEQQKKSLKEVNDLEKDLRDYSEVKGSIKAIKKNLENKNRFARWVAGLKPDIEILDGSIKMLTGKVQASDEKK